MSKLIAIIGCGWLGQALGSALVAGGNRVIGTTTSQPRAGELRRRGIEPVVARFGAGVDGDVSALRDADAIAVAIPPGRGDDAIAEARTVAAMIRETRAVHVVQISTTSVYASERRRVAEPDAIAGHRLSLVENEFRGLDRVATVLRCAGLFGPGRLILPYVLRAGMPVDPVAPVNLVEQSDCVRAIIRAMEEPVADTFNICADEHPSREAFYREIARRAGLGVPEFRSSGEAWKVVDNRRFRDRFGFAYAYPDPLQFPV